MKFRSILAAAAVTLASVFSVFAQSNVKEMAKVVPPNAVAVAYGNNKKIASSMFMRGLLNMMKNHPELKDKCAEIEEELQKNSDGEGIFGVTVNLNLEKPADTSASIFGLVKSGSLETQWDSNIQSLKKERRLITKQGNFNGMDYVSLLATKDAKATGYVLKLDKKTAYFTIVCSNKANEMMKPARPVFYDKQAAVIEKLDDSAFLSIAFDADAVKELMEKISPEDRASISPELEGVHFVVISITEKGRLLQLVAQVYADEKALVYTQDKVNEELAKAKEGQSPFAAFLNGAKVSKKADQVSVTLSVPYHLLLGIIEMSLLTDQANENADAAEPAAPAGKK